MLRTVLVVDDSEMVLQGLQLLLAHYRGTSTVTARDGRAAIDLLRAHAQIDLVLLDVNMPGVDGVETLTRLKRDPLPREVPVVVMASAAEEASARACLDLGARGTLAKPVKGKELQKLVEEITGVKPA